MAKKKKKAAKKKGQRGARKSVRAKTRASAKKIKKKSSKKPTAKKGARKATVKKTKTTRATSKPAAPSAVALPAEEMHGEGSWKSDEEYREGLKEFSASHNAQEPARQAAEEIDEEEALPGKPDTQAEEDSEW